METNRIFPYPYIKNNKLIPENQLLEILQYFENIYDFKYINRERILIRRQHIGRRKEDFIWYVYNLFVITSEKYINEKLEEIINDITNVDALYKYYMRILNIIQLDLIIDKEHIYTNFKNELDNIINIVHNITYRLYNYEELLGYFKSVIICFIKNVKWLKEQNAKKK